MVDSPQTFKFKVMITGNYGSDSSLDPKTTSLHDDMYSQRSKLQICDHLNAGMPASDMPKLISHYKLLIP